MKVLLTGGAGYIGSITNRVLREAGVETVVFDNLTCGHKEAVAGTPLVVGDLQDEADVRGVFSQHAFDAVIHFAAKTLAGESMQQPYEYFHNNVVGALNLMRAMKEASCRAVIFSSTCAVYGHPKTLPVSENAPIDPESVYGASKRMAEEIIRWYGHLYGIGFVHLRYFNAAGALLDGSLGEHHVQETHVIPIALDVALGRRPSFSVFGSDYKTPDGTCVRDYIHVLDLAEAHRRAVHYLKDGGASTAVNLGVGKGYSVLEVLSMVEQVTGKPIPKEAKSRRAGDPDAIYADNRKAMEILSWKPVHSDLETIVASAWKWHQKLNR